MNILYINTSDSKKTLVSFIIKGEVFEESVENSSTKKSQLTLSLIEKVLDKSKKSLKDIEKIKVEKGPGSFTGVRVGVAIANALSFCLRKRVNSLSLSEIELPVYPTPGVY